MLRTAKTERLTPERIDVPLPPLLRQWDVKTYKLGECRVFVGREPMGFTTSKIERASYPLRWHLSISHPDRYPTWDEISDARESLLPRGLVFAQILPSDLDQYVNLHPNCFHLWEVHDSAG